MSRAVFDCVLVYLSRGMWWVHGADDWSLADLLMVAASEVEVIGIDDMFQCDFIDCLIACPGTGLSSAVVRLAYAEYNLFSSRNLDKVIVYAEYVRFTPDKTLR